jgi:3-hydroxymyristoyl/3-hydroxydecanoyl-(acyl carrier protein) dehydratase
MRPISDLIPHRPPWALVDRVVAIEGDSVTAEKLVTIEDFGGLLVLEACAQTAACLMGHRNPERTGHRGYLVAARGWKFPAIARPGEIVTLTATKRSELGALHGFDGAARVADREIANGSMTFAVVFDG